MKQYNRTKAEHFPSPSQHQASASMRKYQQLALALISIISLIAFLFYKHEYDRLHYIFEYLETFGSVADENNVNFCGNKAYRKLSTAPAYWQKLSPELFIYSTFWDVKSFTVLALVLYRGKHSVNVSITNESSRNTTTVGCSLTAEESSSEKNIGLLSCPSNTAIKSPFLARYKASKAITAPSMYIQKSENWKSVINASCICIFSTTDFVPTQKLVEFIAYHNSIGVEKFVFYGHLLTPTIRRILDLNGDEMGIFYEEKQFNVPPEFALSVNEFRKFVEMDCALRHKNFYENVIALQPNEYMIIKGKPSLNAVIGSLPFSQTKMSSFVFRLGLMTQYACYEESDLNKAFVSMDLKMFSGSQNEMVYMIQPHLMLNGHFNQSMDTKQHIPPTSLVIYNFVSCSSLKVSNLKPLLMNSAYSSLIERSLLHRKWTIYD